MAYTGFRIHAKQSRRHKKMTKNTSGACVSCGINLVEKGYVRFACPQCGAEIGRCKKCRHLSNEYECKACGFMGP